MIKSGVNEMKDGVTFLKGEIPHVVEQMIKWYGIESFIYFIIGIVSCFVVMFCIFKIVKKSYKIIDTTKKYDEGNIKHTEKMNIENKECTKLIIYIITGIMFLIFGVCQINLSWLKIWIAPKVWLIEYGKTLVS